MEPKMCGRLDDHEPHDWKRDTMDGPWHGSRERVVRWFHCKGEVVITRAERNLVEGR